MCETPSTSIHRCSQQLNISETSLRRILHKVAIQSSIGSGVDHPMRFRFAKHACDQHAGDADYGKKKIIFSDEGRPLQSMAIVIGPC